MAPIRSRPLDSSSESDDSLPTNQMVTRAGIKRRRVPATGGRELVQPSTSRSERSDSTTTSQLSELANIVGELTKVVGAQTASRSVAPPFTHVKGDAIPTFDPEDRSQNITKWLTKIEDLRHMFGWSEDLTIYYALGKLRGLALVYYNGLASVNFTWEEWKAKLTKAFPVKQDYRTKLEEMLSRKKRPEETFSRYYFEMMAFLNALS